MIDALADLQKLQSLRLQRARREMEQRQRETAAAHEACARAAERRDGYEALALRTQADIRECCQGTPVRMVELQRKLDYVATARHEMQRSVTQLRRLRIVQDRAESALAEARSAYQRCDLRLRAVEKRAEQSRSQMHRRHEARVEEQVLENHAQAAFEGVV